MHEAILDPVEEVGCTKEICGKICGLDTLFGCYWHKHLNGRQIFTLILDFVRKAKVHSGRASYSKFYDRIKRNSVFLYILGIILT
mgnify:CR=1 FL=1